MAEEPVVQLVEEVIICFDRHDLSVCHSNNLLFAILLLLIIQSRSG